MDASIPLIVNGSPHELHVHPDRTLLSVLRDELGLTGTKYGCGDGKCGACTVLVDGQPVQACSASVASVQGRDVITIEGLPQDGRMHPLQQAFAEAGALQCGYCTSGMIMSAAALLAENPAPDDAAIRRALQDNLCRCGAYPRILAAVHRAAQLLQTGGETRPLPPETPADPTQLPPPPDPDEGLVVVFPDPEAEEAWLETHDPGGLDRRTPGEIGPWVHVDGDGKVTVYAGKAEVGQNIRTALAQIVAEELRLPLEAVDVVLGDTARTPYDRGTFGSRSTPITGWQLWRVGATARRTLLELAGAAWNVDPESLRLADGAVEDPAGGRRATFAQLTRDRRVLRMVEEEPDVTPPDQWRVAGHPAEKIGIEDFVTGRHRFAADMALPGMLFGKVLRPPAYHARLLSLDASAAMTMPGVTVVHEDDFVAVTAEDPFTAEQAVDALRARWQTTLQVSQPELFDYLKANVVESDGRREPYLNVIGSVDAAQAEAAFTLSRRYTVDYIAHAPLEPRAALAVWQGDNLIVWTGSQRPFGVRAELAGWFGLPLEQVRVIVPETGSGYGGKHTGEAAIEAARLARATGRPVKVVWTRAEEFTWAYFRPAGLIEVTSSVDGRGRISSLEFHNYNSGAAGIDTLYTIPNQHIEFHPCDSPLRQGAYRALSTTANTFARESHMDELAHRLGADPLAFRLQHLADERMRAVLQAAAEAFGWGEGEAAPGHGFGLAAGHDKGSYVAACAEVAVDPSDGRVRVLRVVEAFDCGAIINPDNLRNQMEGAIVMGLGGALWESVRFANGRILNPNFADYRTPRMEDVPAIETVLIDRKDIPSAGAGETPIVAVAPAVGNAIFQATGVRLRSLPMIPDGRVAR